MAAAIETLAPAHERALLVRRARFLAWGGNAWHFVEFAIAVAAGIAASSIALIGFGFDSLIESLAGFIIVWRFAVRRRDSEAAERRAQQLVAVSFFILAPSRDELGRNRSSSVHRAHDAAPRTREATCRARTRVKRNGR